MPANFPLTRCLLVDDNPIDVLINTRILQKLELVSYVDSVDSGMAALAYLEACQKTKQYPEVILLDVDMPVMNGFEFLSECFSKGLLGESSVKIIMLTSSIHPLDQLKAKAYPIVGYLNKPLKAQSLRTVMQLSESKSLTAEAGVILSW
jgi:CheY-like chemotaxis protein